MLQHGSYSATRHPDNGNRLIKRWRRIGVRERIPVETAQIAPTAPKLFRRRIWPAASRLCRSVCFGPSAAPCPPSPSYSSGAARLSMVPVERIELATFGLQNRSAPVAETRLAPEIRLRVACRFESYSRAPNCRIAYLSLRQHAELISSSQQA
jgi:hypothetical protein